jgi:hypothetical protein
VFEAVFVGAVEVVGDAGWVGGQAHTGPSVS